MSKVRKVLLFVVLPLILLWIILSVFAFSYSSGEHHGASQSQSQVFNDGYLTALRDNGINPCAAIDVQCGGGK